MRLLCGADAEHLGALIDVVRATEKDVDLLKWYLLRLRDEEVDENGEDEVDRHEEEQALEPGVGQEGGEELLEDSVGDILHLGAHSDGLSANVHARKQRRRSS